MRRKVCRNALLALGIWAGICLATALIFSPHLEAVQITPAAAASQELLRVKIQRLAIDPSSGQPVVFLTDPQEERARRSGSGPAKPTP